MDKRVGTNITPHRKAWQVKYDKTRRANRRAAVIALLGGKCARCGFDDPRALQIDHVHGGGSKERKSIGAHAVQDNVLKGIGGPYQLLCANCNWIKRDENNEV